jgi:hypothetical protein
MRGTAGHGVEEMEEGAGSETDDSCAEEDEDWPSGDFVGVGTVFMQFDVLEIVGIHLRL